MTSSIEASGQCLCKQSKPIKYNRMWKPAIVRCVKIGWEFTTCGRL